MSEQKASIGPQKTFEVSLSDMPLCCPTASTELWSAHPRVYLPIEKTGQATCPYCGAEFILKDR